MLQSNQTDLLIEGLPITQQLLIVMGYGALTTTNKTGGLLVECFLRELKSDEHDPNVNSSYVKGSNITCNVAAETIVYFPIGSAIVYRKRHILKVPFPKEKLTFRASDLKAIGQQRYESGNNKRLRAETFRALSRNNQNILFPSWSIFRMLYGSSSTLVNLLLSYESPDWDPERNIPRRIFPEMPDTDHEKKRHTLSVHRSIPETSVDDCVDLACNPTALQQWHATYHRILKGQSEIKSGQMSIDFPWNGDISITYQYRSNRDPNEHRVLNITDVNFSYPADYYEVLWHNYGDEGALSATKSKHTIAPSRVSLMKVVTLDTSTLVQMNQDPASGIFTTPIPTSKTTKHPHKRRAKKKALPNRQKKSNTPKNIKTINDGKKKCAASSLPSAQGATNEVPPITFEGRTENTLESYIQLIVAASPHISLATTDLIQPLPHVVNRRPYSFAKIAIKTELGSKIKSRNALIYKIKYHRAHFYFIDLETYTTQSFNILVVRCLDSLNQEQSDKTVIDPILRLATTSSGVWKDATAGLKALGLLWKMIPHRSIKKNKESIVCSILSALDDLM